MKSKMIVAGVVMASSLFALPAQAGGGAMLSSAINSGFNRAVPLLTNLPFRGSTLGSVTPRSVGLNAIPVVNSVSIKTGSEIIQAAATALPGIPSQILRR